MNDWYTKLFDTAALIRERQPVVLNLTNSVTQDFMANVLLAIGAAPIMSNDQEEVSELLNIAGAVNINIGTLNDSFAEFSAFTVKAARQRNICTVLDPVGAGATLARTKLANRLIPFVNIVRGNASEIISLVDNENSNKGVENTANAKDALQLVIASGQYSETVTVISGKTDYVCSKDKVYINEFGTELMTKVTGMGCCLSAVVAAFAAVESDHALAAYLATMYYTLCADDAYQFAATPARFKVEFIDKLYSPDWEFIKANLEGEINHGS